MPVLVDFVLTSTIHLSIATWTPQIVPLKDIWIQVLIEYKYNTYTVNPYVELPKTNEHAYMQA